MRRRLVIAVIILLALLAVMARRASASDVPGELAMRYQPAVESMAQCYAHATVKGTLRREYPRAKQLLEQDYILRLAGTSIRLDVTTTACEGMGKAVGGGETYVATPDGSLVTYRKPNWDVFSDAIELSYSDAKSRIELSCPLTAPFKVVGGGTILELLKLPDVRIAGVDKITRDGQKLIKVRYDEGGAGNSWFVLSPDEGWAVREYSRTTGHGESQVTRRGILKYAGQHNGVALVRYIDCWEERGRDQTVVQREILNISKFDPQEPDDYYFTSFAF